MRRALGFTVIELLVVIVLIAIAMTIAIPSFRGILENRRVEGVANELSADLQYARSEAVARQANVVLATAADGLSYTITGIPVTKTVTLPAGITVTPSITRTFDPLRGTTGGDAVINVIRDGADQLRISSNFMGRVQLCSPAGVMKGYTTC